MTGKKRSVTKAGPAAAIQPARTLREIPAMVTLEPLESGDPRYVAMAEGRGTGELRQMQIHIEDHEASANRFAKVAFTGHRGCGKSTELLRMEHELASRFTCLHLYVDENLMRDCEYSDLLLWLVESLIAKVKALGLDPPERLMKRVADWFADKTLEEAQTVNTEIRAELEAEAGAGQGILGFTLKVLARIKGIVQGNLEQRHLIRSKLQSYGGELVMLVNDLLDWMASALENKGQRPDILIVQDNLDRLPVEVGRRLFFDNGDLLKRLRAHVIFTHPIAMVLAPYNIGTVFDNCFTMPMVKVQHRDGRDCSEGIEALVSLIRNRVAVDEVFEAPEVARYLAMQSGGSVRDLLRLLSSAQLEARVDEKSRIDQQSANAAVKRMRIDFERLLIPENAYFPLLAQVHASKGLELEDGAKVDAKAAQSARDFFSQLLFNGSVLEYNGDRNWYDVHPVIREIESFRKALSVLNR
jgi:hypothetical protein